MATANIFPAGACRHLAQKPAPARFFALACSLTNERPAARATGFPMQ